MVDTTRFASPPWGQRRTGWLAPRSCRSPRSSPPPWHPCGAAASNALESAWQIGEQRRQHLVLVPLTSSSTTSSSSMPNSKQSSSNCSIVNSGQLRPRPANKGSRGIPTVGMSTRAPPQPEDAAERGAVRPSVQYSWFLQDGGRQLKRGMPPRATRATRRHRRVVYLVATRQSRDSELTERHADTCCRYR